MLNTVRDFQPNVVFLQLGGNDIRSDSTPEEIAYGLLSFATLLRDWVGVQKVIIGHIMLRFEPAGASRSIRWITRREPGYLDRYNECAQAVNAILATEVSEIDRVSFWHHNHKFRFSRDARQCFEEDGVHLSRSGLYKFYKSIRGALTGPCPSQSHCGTRVISRH